MSQRAKDTIQQVIVTLIAAALCGGATAWGMVQVHDSRITRTEQDVQGLNTRVHVVESGLWEIKASLARIEAKLEGR